MSSVRQCLLQCCVVCSTTPQEKLAMQSSTLIVLACLIAAVYARAQPEYPAVDAVQDQIAEDGLDASYDTPVHERSQRTKRGLFLLKKKLLLGALGLKAAKVGAVGAAAALALKKKASVSHHVHAAPHSAPSHSGYSSHGPSWNVEVQSWH